MPNSGRPHSFTSRHAALTDVLHEAAVALSACLLYSTVVIERQLQSCIVIMHEFNN